MVVMDGGKMSARFATRLIYLGLGDSGQKMH